MPLNTARSIAESVLDMYMQHPYPSYSKSERQNVFATELTRYRYLGLDNVLRGSRIVDVGCGTGHRVMPIAQHFGVRQYVGLDSSRASLSAAKELAQELNFDAATFIEGDLFHLPYDDASFDVVISQGVLHHTMDPYRGFKELVRVCRFGGWVSIYLYNRFNHIRHNIQKRRVSRIAGPDIHRRFAVAHRLYGKMAVEEMTPSEIAGFYDQYCHPHKSDHTIGETLKWFDLQQLEYWGSYPALGLCDFMAMAQYRGELLREHPFIHTRLTRAVLEGAVKLPKVVRPGPPFTFPGRFHRFLWQSVYALQGSRGRYSGGPALCGRKVG